MVDGGDWGKDWGSLPVVIFTFLSCLCPLKCFLTEFRFDSQNFVVPYL